MRLTVRTFLCSFVPLVILLAGTFWVVERTVASVVHDALRSTLRNHQVNIAHMQARNEQQTKRYLRILGENTALNVGLRLMLDYPEDIAARLTVEDQLKDIASVTGIDLLVIATIEGAPIVGIVRTSSGAVPVDPRNMDYIHRGIFTHGLSRYQLTSVPLNQGHESLALVCVGERLNAGDFPTPVLLLQGNRVIESSVPGASLSDVQLAVAGCRSQDGECEIRLPQSTYLSLATSYGDGYTLRSLVDLDKSLRPLQLGIRNVFSIIGAVGLLAAVLLTLVSSWSIVKPIARLVAHLRASEVEGKLRAFDPGITAVHEVRELLQAFNRTASAMWLAEQNLHQAYVEFVGSLASALDARDRYTAGHSSRVAAYSCAIAKEMNLTPEHMECIRIGALLHDIGKIGIPDAVLQKPGRLTEQEYAVIQQHPSIGRRILEGVNGFTPYLSVVESHHENWDGTGYPHGLTGTDVPLDARIVHVADAYDAMTSDRPYRRGMSPFAALQILQQHAGTQFDPSIVEGFIASAERNGISPSRREPHDETLIRLADALAAPESRLRGDGCSSADRTDGSADDAATLLISAAPDTRPERHDPRR